MNKIANRLFALFFFIIAGLWLVWEPIFGEAVGYRAPWHIIFLGYATVLIGYPIILAGLAYEIYRPSLNFEVDKNWRWILLGTLLFIVAAIVVAATFRKSLDPGYSLFGSTVFEFPKGSGQLYALPNYLWDFLLGFCMESASFSLLFGTLFMTKSTPKMSKSYKIMLIGGTIWGAAHMMLMYFPFFFLNLRFVAVHFGELTKKEVLTTYWFWWDFWSEFLLLVGAAWLLKRGKN